MIEKQDVMELLLTACPSFRERWEPEYDDEGEHLLYSDLGEFADYIVELYKTHATAEFENIFDAIELLHVEGDEYVQEAATIGLLEGIQNIAQWEDVDPEDFVPFLKPESFKCWNDLNDFWERVAAAKQEQGRDRSRIWRIKGIRSKPSHGKVLSAMKVNLRLGEQK